MGEQGRLFEIESVREGLSKEVTVGSIEVEEEPEVRTFQKGIIIAVNTYIELTCEIVF